MFSICTARISTAAYLQYHFKSIKKSLTKSMCEIHKYNLSSIMIIQITEDITHLPSTGAIYVNYILLDGSVSMPLHVLVWWTDRLLCAALSFIFVT